jgi:arginyl-tRNA--protein-N-Asp/Glu arginylyltransferase
MTELSKIKLFATQPHSCSYLTTERATTVFVDQETPIDASLYNQLIDIGFRRSGQHVYRPQCEQCNACIAARIPIQSFKRKRQHQRIWNKNKDVVVEEHQDISTEPYYQLYERYISTRHRDGDMYPPSPEQYQAFLTDGIGVNKNYVFKLDDKIIAVAVTDRIDSGLSAMYTFFDPDLEKRSLGTYAILWQIERAKALGLAYLYLGYWIKNAATMQYKINFRPLQLLVKNQWVTLN